jgi:hypothetical protein
MLLKAIVLRAMICDFTQRTCSPSCVGFYYHTGKLAWLWGGPQEDVEFRRGVGSSDGSRRAQPRVENVEECPCGVGLYAAPLGMPIGSSEGCWLASARAIDTTCGGRCTATALRSSPARKEGAMTFCLSRVTESGPVQRLTASALIR